ncbi:MAG: hypothetical protein WBP93_17085 [Pyrinomonadaceae bacterium]
MPRRPMISNEYFARIADYQGVIRGKIPAPLVRMMGAKSGDYVVFRIGRDGKVSLSLARAKNKLKGKRKSSR